MRIAPVTHVDQALGRCLGKRRGGFAAPEERWYRAASSRWTSQNRGCRASRLQSPSRLARAGDAQSIKTVKRGVHSESMARSHPFPWLTALHHWLAEAALHVERLAVLQHVVAGPGELVRQGLRRHDGIGLGALSVMEAPSLRAPAPRHV